MRVTEGLFINLILLTALIPVPVTAVSRVAPAPLSADEIEESHRLIRRHFSRNGITYGSGLKGGSPFLDRERCREQYSEYRIRSIEYLGTDRKAHLFRVTCSGYDSCNRALVTDVYRVSVSLEKRTVKYRKVEK